MQGTPNEGVKNSGFQVLLKFLSKIKTPGGKTGESSFGDVFREALIQQGWKKGVPFGFIGGKAQSKALPGGKQDALKELTVRGEKNKNLFSLPIRTGEVNQEITPVLLGDRQGFNAMVGDEILSERLENLIIDPRYLALGKGIDPFLEGVVVTNKGAYEYPYLRDVSIVSAVFHTSKKLKGSWDESAKVEVLIIEDQCPPIKVSIEEIQVKSSKTHRPEKVGIVEEIRNSGLKVIDFESKELENELSQGGTKEDKKLPPRENISLPLSLVGSRFFVAVTPAEMRELTVISVEDEPEAIKINIGLGDRVFNYQGDLGRDENTDSFTEAIKAYLASKGVEQQTVERIAGQVKRVIHLSSVSKEMEAPHPLAVAGGGVVLKEESSKEEKNVLRPDLEKKKEMPRLRSADQTIVQEKDTEKMQIGGMKLIPRTRKEQPHAETTDPLPVTGDRRDLFFGQEVRAVETPPSLPVKNEEIVSQVGRALETYGDKSGRVKIVLEPPHLGEVEMEVIVRGDRVRAIMISENDQVRQVLKSHTEEIKQVLADQGFKVDRMEVKAPEERQLPQWTGNGQEEREYHRGRKDKDKEGAEQGNVNFASYLTTTV